MNRGGDRNIQFAKVEERHCLIVSPHFPPSTLAGVHRARHLAKHLPAHGWQPTILCVDPRRHVERLDPDLSRLVRPDVGTVHAGAIPVWLTRPFGVAGDIGLRGYFHLRAALAAEMSRARPDVVLITGSPYYPMLMARWIRRRWNMPVVLDFQDPWVSHVGAASPHWSKASLAHRLAVALEPHAVRNAAFITSVSDRQNDEMAARYPWLDREHMAGIPIGGDPEDFDALLRARPHSERPPYPVTFSYVGTALPRATPLLRVLFRSLARLRAEKPDIATRLHLRFVGTSNQPNDTATFRIRPLAEVEGVADLVTEEPARVPFLEALGILSTTDVILLIGSDEPHYTASKIYPALMSARPFLSIFHRMSSAHEITARAGGGLALAFDTLEELDALVPAVAEGLKRLATDPGSLGRIDPAVYAPFTAHAVAGRFADVFERAVQLHDRRG
ncbi:MAG: glycosyltransferase [Caulobacteraceae bacterium]